MRNLAMGSHPLTSMFRELEDSFFSPQKYGRTIIANPGTKDKPDITKRGRTRMEAITRSWYMTRMKTSPIPVAQVKEKPNVRP